MNNLKLTHPIVFIDLETTGLSLSTDHIIEIAMVKIMPDGTRINKRKLINPGVPIPPSSTEIHGITDEMVKDAPTFKQAANEIKQFLENCDLGGYNSNRFDVPMLMEEFLRAEMNIDLSKQRMVDVQHIFYTMEPRTLTAAYKFFCNKEMENAHSAEVDIMATIEVFEAQLKRYEQLGDTVSSILETIGEDKIIDYARRFGYNENNEPVFNFGKFKGKTTTDVFTYEPQYYDWIMKSDFALHTKMKATELFNKALLKK
ncbi:MAG: DNA polymerase III subunit epsilon [Niastella sp. SCN 39-18]|nr:3'-5' exonuclease [Sphingobacteriales bacterium]ODT53788.1 MAG: DNA polymerase III subunit epsilon [Niastella sp. SCN 39-18]OJW07647.1 MAG: DNA polymerase III subunit epsilon [Sphingobacteriales bacterium 39-19]